jgi:hypothetical protein
LQLSFSPLRLSKLSTLPCSATLTITFKNETPYLNLVPDSTTLNRLNHTTTTTTTIRSRSTLRFRITRLLHPNIIITIRLNIITIRLNIITIRLNIITIHLNIIIITIRHLLGSEGWDCERSAWRL